VKFENFYYSQRYQVVFVLAFLEETLQSFPFATHTIMKPATLLLAVMSLAWAIPTPDSEPREILETRANKAFIIDRLQNAITLLASVVNGPLDQAWQEVGEGQGSLRPRVDEAKQGAFAAAVKAQKAIALANRICC
jgi:hypothetical protein